MFTDEEFMSAKEKELVLKQWKQFLNKLRTCDFDKKTGSDYGYFPTELRHSFTDRLYKHLSMSFGFIAHYNRWGFLAERFGSYEAVAETVRQMQNDPGWGTRKDINKELVKALNA